MLGTRIQVLTGAQEAELAAKGILMGFRTPDGVAGDLGGGSLELVDVAGDAMREAATLPLGSLRLLDASGIAPETAMAQSKGLIVVFMPPGTDNYLAQWQLGAKQKAADLGYDIKIIESSRDQAEQDAQVQQQIASGEEVAGFIWWPYVNAAGTGSLRLQAGMSLAVRQITTTSGW